MWASVMTSVMTMSMTTTTMAERAWAHTCDGAVERGRARAREGWSYSRARAPELREVRYGGGWANASDSAEGGVTLTLTAPPWCGSTRAVALALDRELDGTGDGDARVIWSRPWRPTRGGARRGIGRWSEPRAEFAFGDARARYGGEWSAAALARAARALRRETSGKNASALALWPFSRLRDAHEIGEFFDGAGTELSLVVLDPCKSEGGCASTTSMETLRRAIVHTMGYSPKNRLGVLMGADAWRVGAKLLPDFDPDDITAVAFVRGALHSTWTQQMTNETIEQWVSALANATLNTVVHRGFFSLSPFSPAVGARKLAMIFVDEADEDVDELGGYIHSLAERSLNATLGVVDISRGTWLLCQLTDACDGSGDDAEDDPERLSASAQAIYVALVDVEADVVTTVNVSPLPDGALSETRLHTRSTKRTPRTPPGTRPPRVAHVTRNQLDYKMTQAMTLRRRGKFSVLYGSSACAFCQRFHALLNAALGDLDSRTLVDGSQAARVFQIDCSTNDCHARWDASSSSLVDRVARYPTLVTFDGARGTSTVYRGAMSAREIQHFLAS